ncbi:histidine phosphatase family protein [Chitinophaga sp. Cy-1792]|uniref:histidine phosphatase family protein n=1 Tax=Chitinophaga sp. Cy-1792 TaxID=2608339 RepID=UPI001420AAD5|nr:histidine phosphatase family protein [Chitinophaga sp. Cy-1792]NIG53620.1 histidine phosphatase family protein [Chitinophaga sp. Cy-1792]
MSLHYKPYLYSMRPILLFSLIGLMMACQPKAPEKQVIPVSDDTTFLTGTVYLVRHAERYEGYDSTLTPEGRIRAGKLYQELKDSGINKIYITRFRRSIETADSFRILGKVDTVFYLADTTGESLIYEITRHEDWGKHLLVIGHANTIVPIIKAFGAKSPVTTIPDKDFEHMFVIKKEKAETTVQERCY